MTSTTRRRLTGWLASIVLVGAVTGLIKLLHPHGPSRGLAVIYILVVVWVAVRWGPAFAFVASVLSVLAFDFFYLDPQYSFARPNLADAEAVVAFLATAVMASLLAGRLRQQVRETTRLAQEQGALRRIASLVARGLPPASVFSQIADEVGVLLGAELALLARADPDGLITVVADWGDVGTDIAVGSRWPLAEPLPTSMMPTHWMADPVEHEVAPGPWGDAVKTMSVRSSIVSSIVIDGCAWGFILLATRTSALPANAAAQMGDFSELLGTAIRNADNRAELKASRARIVAAADGTRRRIERDLHDGAQQRLVALALSVRAAQAAVPPQNVDLRGELSNVADGLVSVLDELRELSHGVHPAVLGERGLQPALRALARRSPIEVGLDVSVEKRLPQQIEVTAYYVVSELLTNAAKHAQASAIDVRVNISDKVLLLTVGDDGVGGADSGRGSGLVGLEDRVAAMGGTISLRSPVGGGTYVHVAIPIVAVTGEPG
jgi:signal transduction histidine kinase